MASPIQQNGVATHPGSTPSQTAVNSYAEQVMGKIKTSNFGQKRNYSIIEISADKWLMAYDSESLKKLENPPSLSDGLGREMEKEIRYLGCELIQSGAILLKLPQTAAATGQILFQRYYYQKSFVRYDFEHYVMACLLLASKIEEEPRKPRDVLNVYHRLKQILTHRRSSNSKRTTYSHLDLGGKDYTLMKNAIIRAERKILNTLGFVVHVHHPHKLIYVFLHVLGLLRNDDNEILQKAWNYMNDGLRTDMFLRYTPETIACACIFLAARTISIPVVLPKQPFPWFELFDASDRDIKSACSMLMDLYSRKKHANYSKLTHEVALLHDRLQLQLKPELVEEASTVNENQQPRSETVDTNLEKIVKKHNEKPSEKSNGRNKNELIKGEKAKNDRKRSRSRDSKRHERRDRDRDREHSRSHKHSRSRSRTRDRKYDDRDREQRFPEVKKRRERN